MVFTILAILAVVVGAAISIILNKNRPLSVQEKLYLAAGIDDDTKPSAVNHMKRPLDARQSIFNSITE